MSHEVPEGSLVTIMEFPALKAGGGGGVRKAIFMAMHTSPDRAEAWREVEPLLEGKVRPWFWTIV